MLPDRPMPGVPPMAKYYSMNTHTIVVLASAVVGFAASVAVAAPCPDLSGKFACPASKRYKQAAMTVDVAMANEPSGVVYSYRYNGAPEPTTVNADGQRRFQAQKKRWQVDSCRDGALVSETFASEKSAKVVKWSKQRINASGDYEVTITGGKVSMLCKRVAAK